MGVPALTVIWEDGTESSSDRYGSINFLSTKGVTVNRPIFACALVALTLTGCATGPERMAGPVTPPPAVWGWGYAAKAKSEMATVFGIAVLKPADFRWAAIPAEGKTRIVISLTDQLAWVYRGEQMIAVTTISSGKVDHESPVGEFPILEKQAFHRSNRYSAAPMPFMLRLNRYGVALHGGMIPGYPASHGCIRLPMAFAKKLYGNVARGDMVFVEG